MIELDGTVAEHLVGGVVAFRLSAALQMPRDALAVVAAELIRPARGRRAVALVRAVRAVVVPVALPPDTRLGFSLPIDAETGPRTTSGCN